MAASAIAHLRNVVSRIPRLHALVDALAYVNRYSDPTSLAYQTRNPLLLHAFSPKHESVSGNIRVFSSFAAGYDNGLLDVAIKCSGKSHSKLTPDNTLKDLLRVYRLDDSDVHRVTLFLRAALEDEDIVESTRLSWFLEDLEKSPLKSVTQ